uniref:Ig-like domain-containing protein n=1 Tax=Sparus aurata TaxID=8175 RepID=A0A671U0L5_SPAAU
MINTNVTVNYMFVLSGSSEDLVKPFKDVMLAVEGDTVTLSCNYSGTVISLYWYQQKSSSSPQFLIREGSEKTRKLSVSHDRDRKEFHLQISSAAVTDSAVYYCALQPHSDRKHQNSVQKPLEQRQHNTPQHPLEGVTHC